MRRFLFVAIVLAPLGCRRHHAPVPEVEEPSPAAAPSAPAQPAEPITTPSAQSGITEAAAAMPDGGTMNGDARGLRAADFNRVLAEANAPMRACFDDAAPPLPAGSVQATVHFTVERGGYTGGVRATGAVPEPVLECLKGVARDLRFPEYRGEKIERDIPLTWTKKETVISGPRDAAAATK